MSEGKLKNCHIEKKQSFNVNISAYSHPSFSLENVKGSSNYKIIKSGRLLDLAFQLGAMTRRDCHVASLLTITTFLFSFNAHATCTPTPDCADMGYTETSCSGKFVRCPFDTSKLFCAPCDSKFQYTCTNEGQVGKGNSCNGKYIECECSVGYDLVAGNCIISCAYTATSLPTGCSSADSCEKNGSTYYSSTCSECKNGYTLSSGSCSANACSGYYSSKTGCSSYSSCLSGTTTKYKCTACNTGYSLSSGQCKANTCDGYNSSKTGCSNYTTCSTPTETKYKCTNCNSGYTLNSGKCSVNSCSGYQPYKTGCSSYTSCSTPTGTKYKCTACKSNYELVNNNECIDEYCYNDYHNTYPTSTANPTQSDANNDCPYYCTGPTSGVKYGAGGGGAWGCDIN